jgi:anti-anti-sigma factor
MVELDTSPGGSLVIKHDMTASELRLSVDGILDLSSRGQFGLAMERALSRLGGRRLVIDLGGVDAIDATGLGELIASLTRCDQGDAAWTLLPSQAVERLLVLVGVGRRRSDQSGSWLASGDPGDE